MREITFIIEEDQVSGGYTAHARWPDGNRDIFTEGNTREELIRNIREALDASFSDDEPKPQIVHIRS